MPIHGTVENEAVQGLDRTAGASEFGSKVIQQLRMTRSLSPEAEVIGRFHQTATEVLLPNPIDHHPRRQRIGRIGQPTGQFEATAGGRGRSHGVQAQGRQGTPAYPLTRLVGFAPHLDHSIPRGAFGHAIGQRKGAFHQELLQFPGRGLGSFLKGFQTGLDLGQSLATAFPGSGIFGSRHHQRRITRRERGFLDSEVVGIQRRLRTRTVSVAIDENIINGAIPSRVKRP